MTRPENTITTPVITVLKPRPDSVQISATCISIVIADASTTVAVNETRKQTAAAALAGGGSAHFPRPTSGNRKPAKTIIGIIRMNVVAVRNAIVRAYQNAYRSTGRSSSYATAPLIIFSCSSASTFHGSTPSSACPSQTYAAICGRLIGDA